ncbi:MAG: hypothetical protein MZV63_62970, partial [Marinilabiliales bacterium]|nr:hypothetical protein [Marinilabiliales bacterium]
YCFPFSCVLLVKQTTTNGIDSTFLLAILLEELIGPPLSAPPRHPHPDRLSGLAENLSSTASTWLGRAGPGPIVDYLRGKIGVGRTWNAGASPRRDPKPHETATSDGSSLGAAVRRRARRSPGRGPRRGPKAGARSAGRFAAGSFDRAVAPAALEALETDPVQRRDPRSFLARAYGYAGRLGRGRGGPGLGGLLARAPGRRGPASSSRPGC